MLATAPAPEAGPLLGQVRTCPSGMEYSLHGGRSSYRIVCHKNIRVYPSGLVLRAHACTLV